MRIITHISVFSITLPFPMKKQFKSFTTFTRAERIGLLCLTGLLIVLIAIRVTMSLWVAPPADTDKGKRLVAAWEVFKRSQHKPAANAGSEGKKDFEDATDENTTPLPDLIDINTADSATLVRLKGIGPITAGRIIACRKENGPFTSITQLRSLGHFTNETFDMLQHHLSIGGSK